MDHGPDVGEGHASLAGEPAHQGVELGPPRGELFIRLYLLLLVQQGLVGGALVELGVGQRGERDLVGLLGHRALEVGADPETTPLDTSHLSNSKSSRYT